MKKKKKKRERRIAGSVTIQVTHWRILMTAHTKKEKKEIKDKLITQKNSRLMEESKVRFLKYTTLLIYKINPGEFKINSFFFFSSHSWFFFSCFNTITDD